MGDSPTHLLRALRGDGHRVVDRAVAAIWWHSLSDPSHGVTFSTVVTDLATAGYSAPNRTRLRKALEKDIRTRRVGAGLLGISLRQRDTVEQQFADFLAEKPIPPSDSILPRQMFVNSRRGYLLRVVDQLNASFDGGLYDCTTVMCRRLLETLIIEAYEANGRADLLKGPDGHFRMLSGLMSVLDQDSEVNLGRESLRGLRDFKSLGDRSAHNRRFNARRDDIVRVRDGLRLASEELLHLANLV